MNAEKKQACADSKNGPVICPRRCARGLLCVRAQCWAQVMEPYLGQRGFPALPGKAEHQEDSWLLSPTLGSPQMRRLESCHPSRPQHLVHHLGFGTELSGRGSPQASMLMAPPGSFWKD